MTPEAFVETSFVEMPSVGTPEPPPTKPLESRDSFQLSIRFLLHRGSHRSHIFSGFLSPLSNLLSILLSFLISSSLFTFHRPLHLFAPSLSPSARLPSPSPCLSLMVLCQNPLPSPILLSPLSAFISLSTPLPLLFRSQASSLDFFCALTHPSRPSLSLYFCSHHLL